MMTHLIINILFGYTGQSWRIREEVKFSKGHADKVLEMSPLLAKFKTGETYIDNIIAMNS